MKLTLGGKTYESSLRPLINVSIKEARAIREKTGLTIGSWQQGLKDLGLLDERVLVGLVLLFHLRAKEEVDWDMVEDMTIEEFGDAFDFDLTDGDRADIAEAGTKDWAEPDGVEPVEAPVTT